MVNQALLKAIAANLDEDTPRLEYADWLAENATSENSFAERAEFIRLQISLATGIDVNSASPMTEETTREYKNRAIELLGAHRAEWEAEISQALGDGATATFNRGFPSCCHIYDIRKLVNSGIFESERNTITELDVSVRSMSEFQVLLTFQHIDRIKGIDLRHIGLEEAEVLASPHFSNLSYLSLGYNLIGDEGAEAIANSPHLAGLTYLDLSSCGIGDAGVAAIATSPHLTSLTHLNMSNNPIGQAAVATIANLPHLSGLTYLDLSFCGIGDIGATAIAISEYLTSLTHLNLSNNPIEHAGAMAIADFCATLTYLNLRACGIGDIGATAIANSPQMARLTHLNLQFCDIGNAGATAIATSQHLSLSAKLTGLRSAGYDALAEQVERNSGRTRGGIE